MAKAKAKSVKTTAGAPLKTKKHITSKRRGAKDPAVRTRTKSTTKTKRVGSKMSKAAKAHLAAAKVAKAAVAAETKAKKLLAKAEKVAAIAMEQDIKDQEAASTSALAAALAQLADAPPGSAPGVVPEGDVAVSAFVPREPHLLVDCPVHKIDIAPGLLEQQPIASQAVQLESNTSLTGLVGCFCSGSFVFVFCTLSNVVDRRPGFVDFRVF